jgi:hypothetical protein
MKTVIFYIFYSENKKKYYSIKSDLIDLKKIHKIVLRRMVFSKNQVIDLDYEINIREEKKVKIYHKYGNLDFLGEHYKSLILKITSNNNSPSYYMGDGEVSSRYHLDLIQIDSFLSDSIKNGEKELSTLKNKIRITWLFG